MTIKPFPRFAHQSDDCPPYLEDLLVGRDDLIEEVDGGVGQPRERAVLGIHRGALMDGVQPPGLPKGADARGGNPPTTEKLTTNFAKGRAT